MLTACVLPIWNKVGGVYQLLPPPPPHTLLGPGLALPWLWALLSLSARPGPLTSGIIMVRLPVPPARIFAALGVVFNSAPSNRLSRSWWQYFYSSAWKLDTWGHTLYKQHQGCWATVTGGSWQQQNLWLLRPEGMWEVAGGDHSQFFSGVC